MISKIFKRLTAAAISAVTALTVSGSISVRDKVKAYEEESKAFLEYDTDADEYILLNADGERFDTSFYFSAKINDNDDAASQAAVTTAPEAEQTPTVPTTVSEAVTTAVTYKQPSAATTVSVYAGRYRSGAFSEKEDILNAYTTTAAATTTTTTTTTTKAAKIVNKGIDVSRYQGDIDWAKVKRSGIAFVIIRAGYGMEYDQVDSKFHANIKGAQAAGLDCGVYWYSYALSTSEALKEAKVCYNTIKGYKFTYPVAFDIEDPTQKNLTQTQISNITKTFCDYLEGQKYYVSVYSYASMLNDKMNSSVLSKYDIWVAHTGVSKPNFNGTYGMWQYSWEGSVPGISGDVDLDYGYKDYPTTIKNNHLNGY